jgi:hypothetical protein
MKVCGVSMPTIDYKTPQTTHASQVQKNTGKAAGVKAFLRV